MIKRNLNLLWGLLLVVGGALLLLQNLGLLGNFSIYIWAGIFFTGGIVFTGVFFTNRARWWAIIPGVVLLGLGAVMLLTSIDTPLGDDLIGVTMLGSVGLAFWLAYAFRREAWWALIPAGVLTTLAVVVGLEERAGGLESGVVFFAGLAITFLLIFLTTRMQWAGIASLALAGVGVLIFLGLERLTNYAFPIALIVVGLFLLLRVLRPAR